MNKTAGSSQATTTPIKAWSVSVGHGLARKWKFGPAWHSASDLQVNLYTAGAKPSNSVRILKRITVPLERGRVSKLSCRPPKLSTNEIAPKVLNHGKANGL